MPPDDEGSAGATDRWHDALYPSDERPGAEIGPYTLVSVIGRGGFGTVWKAVRRHPFAQTVAIKFLHSRSGDVIARFEQERQILASLNHPGIAQVHEGGMTAAGRPYFAMEFVEGLPVTRYCDEKKLAVPDRLRLFIELCEAVQHAHTAGVIHRDLKPGNVLVARGEGDRPHVKVIDFGMAKAMSGTMAQNPLDTIAGRPLGTYAYMSPEQASRDATRIDFRTDVYSLGVMLYELLVGSLPFEPDEFKDRDESECKRLIREEEPPSPSVRISAARSDARQAESIERARGIRIEELARDLRSELEWIPLMAMRKERERRYERPIDLGRDIANYLEGRPLVAAPESRVYLARKWMRRHQALLTGAAAVALSLAVGVAVAVWQGGEIIRQRDSAIKAQQEARDALESAKREAKNALDAKQQALAEKENARAAEARADELKQDAIRERDNAVKASKESDRQRRRAQDLLDFIATSRALEALDRGEVLQVGVELAALEEGAERLEFPARFARAMSDQSICEPLQGHWASVSCVAFRPDGGMIATGGRDGRVCLWNAETHAPIGAPLAGHGSGISSIAFSRDGKMLASGSYDQTIRLWDVENGRPIGQPLRGHTQYVQSVSFHPDGDMLASGSSDGTIRFWSVRTGAPDGEPLEKAHEERVVQSVAFSPSGKLLASGGLDLNIRLWDVSTRRPACPPLRGHEVGVMSVAFSPDGTMLASGGADDNIMLWDVALGAMTGRRLEGHGGVVHSVAFDPSGRRLASASEDDSIRIWDVEAGKAVGGPLRGHAGDVLGVAFSQDGRTLASGGEDKRVRLWALVDGRPAREYLVGHERSVECMAFSPNGDLIASGGADDTVRLWDVLTGEMVGVPLRGHEGRVSSVAFSPDGRLVASSGGGRADASIRVWEVATGRMVLGPLRGHALRNDAGISALAFSPGGEMLASGGADGTLRFWSTRTGAALEPPLAIAGGALTSLAWSRDGTHLAVGCDEGDGLDRGGKIWLWDVRAGVLDRASGRSLEGPVRCLAFSPDGLTLAAGGHMGVRRWSVETGQPIGGPLRDGREVIRCLAFSPDGETLASGCAEGLLRLWDTDVGRLIGDPLPGSGGAVSAIAFSPDGNILATAGSDRFVRLQHSVPIRERIGAIRARLAEVDLASRLLSPDLAEVQRDEAEWARLQERVLADARFGGELARAARIVIGRASREADAARKRDREQRLAGIRVIEAAVEERDCTVALRAVLRMPPEVLDEVLPDTWNRLAWRGLTELPVDAPERDLPRLRGYAERAAELSSRGDAQILDTLARAHWELGNKAKAIEIQQEAIAVAISQRTDESGLAELGAVLARYEATEPPKPPEPNSAMRR